MKLLTAGLLLVFLAERVGLTARHLREQEPGGWIHLMLGAATIAALAGMWGR